MISLRSELVRKLLEYFFLNPDERHYVNELARMLSIDPKNLHTKLVVLEHEGLFGSEFLGKQRYFFLKKNYPLLKEYQSIVFKSSFEKRFRAALQSVSGISTAYFFGSYAKEKMDSASDIDLLIVGEHSIKELQKKVNVLQKETGREVNAVSMGKEEFLRKKRNHDPFLKNVFSGKHIKLI